MKKLAMQLEDVISGQTFSESVLLEAKLHVKTDAQRASIVRYIDGHNTVEDWRELQNLVIVIQNLKPEGNKVDSLQFCMEDAAIRRAPLN